MDDGIPIVVSNDGVAVVASIPSIATDDGIAVVASVPIVAMDDGDAVVASDDCVAVVASVPSVATDDGGAVIGKTAGKGTGCTQTGCAQALSMATAVGSGQKREFFVALF